MIIIILHILEMFCKAHSGLEKCFGGEKPPLPARYHNFVYIVSAKANDSISRMCPKTSNLGHFRPIWASSLSMVNRRLMWPVAKNQKNLMVESRHTARSFESAKFKAQKGTCYRIFWHNLNLSFFLWEVFIMVKYLIYLWLLIFFLWQ